MGVARYGWDDIFGYQEIKEKAKLLSKQDVDVLIIGETGTGKKLFAEAIHNNSSRKLKPFVTVQLTSIPDHLFESELFGHRKGAFTDAREDKIGLLESANLGTLFFDEIGDLALGCQAKLLRVLEEKKIRKVGENNERDVDIRFLIATNRDLWIDVSGGRFRADLLFRIWKYVLRIPPLRDRRKDFREIVEGLWRRIIRNNKQLILEEKLSCDFLKGFEKEEIALLSDYDFPGNVRQLEALLSRVFFYWKESEFKKSRLHLIKEEMAEGKGLSSQGKSWEKLDPYKEMVLNGLSFWEVVHKKYLNHEISKEELKEIIRKGLDKTGWSFKQLLSLFNIEPSAYKRFLNFLQNQGIKLKDLHR